MSGFFFLTNLLGSQEISFYFYLKIIKRNTFTNSISKIHKYFRFFYHMRTDTIYNLLSDLGIKPSVYRIGNDSDGLVGENDWLTQ